MSHSDGYDAKASKAAARHMIAVRARELTRSRCSGLAGNWDCDEGDATLRLILVRIGPERP